MDKECPAVELAINLQAISRSGLKHVWSGAAYLFNLERELAILRCRYGLQDGDSEDGLWLEIDDETKGHNIACPVDVERLIWCSCLCRVGGDKVTPVTQGRTKQWHRSRGACSTHAKVSIEFVGLGIAVRYTCIDYGCYRAGGVHYVVREQLSRQRHVELVSIAELDEVLDELVSRVLGEAAVPSPESEGRHCCCVGYESRNHSDSCICAHLALVRKSIVLHPVEVY